MAFCTSCGAQVNGAFCVQCGTPVKAAGATVPPPPSAQPMPPPPIKPGTSPIVWIIAIVGGLIVLGGIAVVGAGLFFVHKVKQYGDNPGYAAAKTIVALTPNLTEVSHDDNAGTITIRDNKSGQVMTWNFDDIKNGKFRISGTDDKGNSGTVEIGAGGKLPAWVPAYPGSNPAMTFSATGSAADGSGSGGNYTFTTRDPLSKVVDFYKAKFDSLGMKTNVAVQVQSNEGQILSATDEVGKRHMTVILGADGGQTTVNVTFAGKD